MTVIKALKAGLLALLLCCSAAAWADVAVPALSGRVVDQTMTLSQAEQAALDATLRARSEERRVGKECWITCRYRWSPYH